MTPFRDRLDWQAEPGRIMDGPRRYLLLRPEALMGILRRLDPPARLLALEAFAASVLEMGADSARAYQAMGGGSGEALAQTVADSAPDLGWGRWQFRFAPGTVLLDVADSPFAAGFGPAPHAVCHPIRGMLAAVAGLVFHTAAMAQEVECAAMGAALCRFRAVPA